MFLISPENLPRYLAGRGLAAGEDEISVRELPGGVSNIVLLIERRGGPERRWVAKQSLGKLRVKDDWRSDRARIFREADALRALRQVLGDSIPELVHVDRKNFLFIMTAAPTGSAVWKEMLLGRRADLPVARQAGALLARMINASRLDPSFHKKFWDGTVFDQLRIDPYYRTTAARQPGLRGPFEELISASRNIQTALVHGDYSPKNIMVRGDKIFLIDFEVVHWGDPAFDSGFLLSHLFLKAFHQRDFREFYFDAAREFWKTLLAGVGTQGAKEFERMTLRHLGGLMLARIDGKSPVEYIQDDATKERVRRTAKRILLEGPERLEDVLKFVP